MSYVLKWRVIKGIQHKKTSLAKFWKLIKIKKMLLYIWKFYENHPLYYHGAFKNIWSKNKLYTGSFSLVLSVYFVNTECLTLSVFTKSCPLPNPAHSSLPLHPNSVESKNVFVETSQQHLLLNAAIRFRV